MNIAPCRQYEFYMGLAHINIINKLEARLKLNPFPDVAGYIRHETFRLEEIMPGIIKE